MGAAQTAKREIKVELASPVIRLDVPAQARFVRVARMTTSSLFATLGADVERIEDLRIAVDELVTALVPCSTNGAIQLGFRIGEGLVEVEGCTRAVQVPEVDALTHDIVSGVVGDYALAIEGDTVSFRFAVALGDAGDA